MNFYVAEKVEKWCFYGCKGLVPSSENWFIFI